LEHLVAAFQQLTRCREENYGLVIAGKPEEASEEYFRAIREGIREQVESGKIVLSAYHIPDEATELYFKAADVLVLQYRGIYQSGVLFLAYSFGLPVIAADVGSLRDAIVEGQTGFVFKPGDCQDLARAITRYFDSDLYADLSRRRRAIIQYANQKHSWDVVGQETMKVYARLLQNSSPEILLDREAPTISSM
jgi:glycosyltransferase involved in cell wall biosynthesis